MNLPTSIIATCKEIAENRREGSHDLARRSVKAMAEMLEERAAEALDTEQLLDLIGRCASSLAKVRPAITSIANAVAELYRRVEEACKVTSNPLDTARTVAAHHLSELDRSLERTQEQICTLVSSTDTVLTVSRSRTVLEGLKAARPARIIVVESRPHLEGRQTAAALLDAGLEVELVIDAMGPGIVGEATLVIVGANAILPDGALVNKVGSLGIALAAHHLSVPFYAACESLKISPGRSMLIELNPGSEIWKTPPPGLSIRNIYAERVEPMLITGMVTERGVVEPREASRIASVRRRALTAIGVGDQ